FVISQREGEDIAIAVRSEPSPIPEHALPRFWNGREPDSTILPVVYERDGQYFIRPNGAILHALAEHIREDTPIALGTVVEVGAPTANRAALRLVPRAEVRVQARSVFGNVTSALAEVLLEPAGPSAPAAALIRDEVTP
ncbi:MAG: hypothetical protein OEY14_08675, partial [Myxococcales bacterium]|nr:hypothetical protein [Myxococcales bacterium]